MAVRPFCYECRSSVRSMAEHLTTARHRERTTSVRSSGPRGSSAYRPAAVLPRPEREYDAMLEERWLATLPPSVDELFPTEVMDDDAPAPMPAERAYRPEPCARCGKTFRTDAGRSWHMTRNLRCERWRPARARLAS